MAWIESHQSLRDHPKLKRLARKLGKEAPAAIGYLHLIWWWAMNYASDGNISKYDPEDIADAAMWNGEAGMFMEALIDCEFIDISENGAVIHDWYDYAGKLLEKRESDAKRKRDARRQKDEKCMSNGHPTDGAGTVPYRTEPTVPNLPNQPNQTEPYLPEQHLAELEAQRLRDEKEKESSAASNQVQIETVNDVHLKYFGTMTMSPAMSNFIQKLRDRNQSEEFVKELFHEAGETSNGGKPPIRFMQTIADSWIKAGIETREQAAQAKKKAGGSSINRTRGKPQLPIVTDQGTGKKMMTKEEYRISRDNALHLDGKPLMTDAEFEQKWTDYEARWRDQAV